VLGGLVTRDPRPHGVATLSGWAFAVAQQIHGAWGGALLAGR
jgi:hypothetical protein